MKGQDEHGRLTIEKLEVMDLDRLLREEILDAFWYIILKGIQKQLPPNDRARAYSAGILQLDGDDLPQSAKQGDLFIVMKDTPKNRELQAELLRANAVPAPEQA